MAVWRREVGSRCVRREGWRCERQQHAAGVEVGSGVWAQAGRQAGCAVVASSAARQYGQVGRHARGGPQRFA